MSKTPAEKFNTLQLKTTALAAHAVGVWVALSDIAHAGTSEAAGLATNAHHVFTKLLKDLPSDTSNEGPFRPLMVLHRYPHEPSEAYMRETNLWMTALTETGLQGAFDAQGHGLADSGVRVVNAMEVPPPVDKEPARVQWASRQLNVREALDNLFTRDVEPYVLVAMACNRVGAKHGLQARSRFIANITEAAVLEPLINEGPRRSGDEPSVLGASNARHITEELSVPGLRGDFAIGVLGRRNRSGEVSDTPRPNGLETITDRIACIVNGIGVADLLRGIETGTATLKPRHGPNGVSIGSDLTYRGLA